MNIITGHFEADGALINLPLGFIPDYYKMWDINGSSSVAYEWWYDMELDGAAAIVEGLSITIAAGASAIGDLADGEGISAYSTRTDSPTITTWTTAVGTAATARTSTAAGTFVKPTGDVNDINGNPADTGAIFECVTAGTSGSTEPSWNVDKDGYTTDGTTVWQLVVEATRIDGYQGVTIAAALMTDGQECYYLGLQSNTSKDQGDVASWTSGISPDVL